MDGHPTRSDRTEPFSTEALSCACLAVRDGRDLGSHPGGRMTFPPADDLSARDILTFLNEQIRAVERELSATLRLR